jgi:acyl-CoA thioester hydrolase
MTTMKFNGTTFESQERVRWGDVDASGSIFFGAYVRMVEHAEVEFLRALGFSFKRFDELGVRFRRVHLEFDFFKPAWLDDDLLLCISVANVGEHSVRLEVAIRRPSDEVELTHAALVSACVDANHETVTLPEELASALRVHATTADVARG